MQSDILNVPRDESARVPFTEVAFIGQRLSERFRYCLHSVLNAIDVQLETDARLEARSEVIELILREQSCSCCGVGLLAAVARQRLNRRCDLIDERVRQGENPLVTICRRVATRVKDSRLVERLDLGPHTYGEALAHSNVIGRNSNELTFDEMLRRLTKHSFILNRNDSDIASIAPGCVQVLSGSIFEFTCGALADLVQRPHASHAVPRISGILHDGATAAA